MNWFSGCDTVATIKSLYRKLAMDNHPDRGGCTATMQDINAAYESALKGKHGAAEVGSDGVEHTYYWNEEQERAVMAKLYELLRHRLPGCEVWLIGRWLWVVGDTRPVKEVLKAAGLQWHSKRGAWYWRPAQAYSHYNKAVDLNALASYYGAKMFETTDNPLAVT